MKSIIYFIFILFTFKGYTQFSSINPNVDSLGTSYGISFLDMRNGYLLSHNSINWNLYRTQNGGQTWSIQSNPNAFAGDFKFINDSIGFMKGSPIKITKDYGKTFQDASNPAGITISPYLVYVGSGTDIFALFGGEGTFKSDDLGKCWIKVFDNYLRNLHFINDSTGYAFSYIGTDFYLYITINIGDNWTLKYEIPFQPVDFQFLNQDTAYFYSRNVVIRTFNGGASWDTCYDQDQWLHGMQFISPTTGFLADESGIFKTINSGNSWEQIAPPQDANEMQVFYEDSKVYIYLNMYNAGYTSILRGVFDSTQIWNSTEDLSKMSLKDKFKVFPNPTTHSISITYTGFIAADTKARLYDIQGKLVLEKPLALNKTEIDMKDLSKGVYVLKIESEEGVFLEKVVKE